VVKYIYHERVRNLINVIYRKKNIHDENIKTVFKDSFSDKVYYAVHDKYNKLVSFGSMKTMYRDFGFEIKL